MNRREALIHSARMAGYTITMGTAMSIVQGCGVDRDVYKPSFFENDSFDLISRLVDRLLPRTETPGGLDVMADRFLDIMLAEATNENDQLRYKQGLQEFLNSCRKEFGKAALKCSTGQLDFLLHGLADDPSDSAGRFFFRKNKELALLGYFTSEQIGTEVLRYDPVPGQYRGCIPFAEVGTSWTL